MVDAIIGAESGVFTYGGEMNRVSSMSGKAEEGKNGKEQDGKREGIEEGSHCDESNSSCTQLCKEFMWCFYCIYVLGLRCLWGRYDEQWGCTDLPFRMRGLSCSTQVNKPKWQRVIA